MVPGSSEWFERGFVTYTDVAKQEMLGVQAPTLHAHGAVSEQTVREMVAGALAQQSWPPRVGGVRCGRPGRRHAEETRRHGMSGLGT